MEFGNRIPKKYFVTSGVGESDITIHAGSFDQALKEAGIHNVNIIQYSSIIPKEAERVEKKELHFGSVVETIMAVANGMKGERITAGLIVGWVYKNGKKIGGLVAEYHGNDEEEKAREILIASLKEMFSSRFSEEFGGYELKDIEIYTRSFIPRKKYGTVIVAIVFLSYEYPEKE